MRPFSLPNRQYLIFDMNQTTGDDFCTNHGAAHVEAAMRQFGALGEGLVSEYLRSPSNWHATFSHCGPCKHPVGKKISSVVIGQPDQRLLELINSGSYCPGCGLSAIGSDLPIHLADYWNPAESPDPVFATRKRAHALMGIGSKPSKPGAGANVIIVDQGLNEEYIKQLGGNFAGGWYMDGMHQPGESPIGHGSMLARNILKVAPEVTLFDAPIIPVEMEETVHLLSNVHAAFIQILASIECLKKSYPREEQWLRPWIFVNAWATFNSGQEHPRGNYSCEVEHQLNRLIKEMASEHDLIFAAGNCGQFCPSRRCGIGDIGPGHSIIGANSHPDVLTVGAVRADGMWLGYSSQGPGTLSPDKPDLCAASQFSEDGDAQTINTGTSAACALAAGVVGALRSEFGRSKIDSQEIKRILMESASAKPASGKDWDGRLGGGIINLSKARKSARKRMSLGP